MLKRPPRLHPQPHVLDARALAALRVLLGLYVLQDIARRLSEGPLSLAWYTSDPDEGSILAADDTPHGHWLHRDVWFHRGGARLQQLLFVATGVTAATFVSGRWCGEARREAT